MFKWKWIVKTFAIPAIEFASEDYRNLDDNDTGKDDAIGFALQFCADLLKAILTDKPLPEVPEVLIKNQ